MRCLFCPRGPRTAGEYGVYERGGVEVMVCQRHQPLSEKQLRRLEARLPVA